ncbi:MAG: hypothetical protein H6645_01515 [Caldilineaceae bacterium]|nr:hypothetical protein [Caldilineaceae bacterium]
MQLRFRFTQVFIIVLALAAATVAGCTMIEPQSGGTQSGASLAGAAVAQQALTVQFNNQTAETVEIWSPAADGTLNWQFDLAAGQSQTQQAAAGQQWVVYKLNSEEVLLQATTDANNTTVNIGAQTAQPTTPPAQPTAPAAQPATPTQPAAQPPAGASGMTAAEEQAALQAHNAERANTPGVAPLQWSPELAQFAAQWAQQIAATGNFEHRSGTDLKDNNPLAPGQDQLGENLSGATTGSKSVAQHVQGWIDEKADYDYASNTCADGKQCGHYTQVVWKNTQLVGCGKATGNGWDYVVCNYHKGGNYVGQKPY